LTLTINGIGNKVALLNEIGAYLSATNCSVAVGLSASEKEGAPLMSARHQAVLVHSGANFQP
jgi:hypothetical protein